MRRCNLKHEYLQVFEPQMFYALCVAFFTQIDHEPLPMGMIYKPWGDLTKIFQHTWHLTFFP